MNTFKIRMHRFTRLALAAFGLLLMLNSVSLAEGWGNNRPPTLPPASVTSTEIVYGDGCLLYADGTYINGDGTFHYSPAAYELNGDMVYSDGTVLHDDGTWTAGTL